MSNIKNIPEKIYLQIGDECPDDADFNELSEVSWNRDKIYENDIEFMQNKVSDVSAEEDWIKVYSDLLIEKQDFSKAIIELVKQVKHSIVNERKDNVGAWVKASERLPDSYDTDVFIKGYKKLHKGKLILREYGTYGLIKLLDVQGFKVCEWGKGHEELENIEWLDESHLQQEVEESEKELEERTERNMNVISDFCEHLKDENIVIPEEVILSFFNA